MRAYGVGTLVTKQNKIKQVKKKKTTKVMFFSSEGNFSFIYSSFQIELFSSCYTLIFGPGT